MDVSETKINTDGISEEAVSCIERNYDPRVTLEQYATGPSPGGCNSRESDDSGKEQSKDNRLSPLLSSFKQLPLTEASAISCVPLTEIQDIPEDSACSLTGNTRVPTSQSIKDAKTEKEGMSPYMSLSFQQPIYENLGEEPEKAASESHWTKCFDNENPSKSLEAVDDKDGTLKLSNSAPALYDKMKIYQRLRPLNSPERIYGNVYSTDERRAEQSGNNQFASISDSAQNFGPAASPKNRFEPLITSSMPSHYNRLESYKRLEPFASSERIYANVQPLGGNEDREQNVNHQFINKANLNSSQIENQSEISAGTLSSPSKGIYMNLPNYLYEKQTCRKKKISMNRTVDSPAYTERRSSETGEHALTAKSTASNRRDTNQTRSKNIHVSSFKASPKFHVEQKSVEVKNDTSTVQKLASPKSHLRNKNDSSNICSTNNTKEHNAHDQKTLLEMDLPLKGNEKQLQDYFRVSKTESSTSNRFRGTNLGEYFSLSNQFVEHSRFRGDIKIANSLNMKRTEYDNPIYGDNKSVKNIEDENLTKMEEIYKKATSADDSIAFQLNTTRTGKTSSNNPLITKKVLNETFFGNKTSSLSDNFEENSKSQQYPALGEGDTTFVQEMNAITSEDEDPICLSKSLKDESKYFETGNEESSSYISSFSKYSISKTSYLEPFSKYTNSTSTYPEDNTMHPTKTSDNVLSSRKQIESVNTASTEEGCLKDFVCHTSFKVSKLEQSRRRNDSNRETSPSNSRKRSLIFPPLDQNYLSSSLESSDNISPSKTLNLPIVINSSSVVQSQLQKYSSLSTEKICKSSFQALKKSEK